MEGVAVEVGGRCDVGSSVGVVVEEGEVIVEGE